MASGKLWTTRDRFGNEIYLTDERWEHIVEPINHPDMVDYFEELKETIERGQRRQDGLSPQKYRYTRQFSHLSEDNTHIVAIVLFRFRADAAEQILPNNYVATAYQKEIGS